MKLVQTSRRRLMALAIAIQAAGLFAFTTYIAIDKYRDFSASAEVEAAVIVSEAARELVIELQGERAFSAMHLANGRARFGPELAAWRETAEQRRAALENSVARLRRDGRDAPPEAAAVAELCDQVGALRREVDHGAVGARESFGRFSRIIGDFIGTFIDRPPRGSSRIPVVMAAYNNLLLAQESLGQLRGLGALGLFHAPYDPDLVRQLLALDFRHDSLIDAALRHLTSAERQEFYDSVISPTIDAAARRMRQAAIDSLAGGQNLDVESTEWFAVQSAQISRLSLVAVRTADRIIGLASAERDRALRDFIIVLLVAVALSLFSVALARTSERRARLAGERLTHAIDSIDEAVALWGPDDRLVQCNRRYFEILGGLGAAPRLGMAFDELVRQAAAARPADVPAEAWIEQRVRDHRTGRDSVEGRMADGRWRLVRERRLVNGETVELYVDITDLRQRDEQVQKLFRAVEQSPVPVLITDADGRIEYANPSLLRTSGLAAADVIGRTPRVFKTGNNPSEVYAGLWRTIKAGQEWRGELSNRRHDGSVGWDLVTISPVLGPDGRPLNFIAVREDVTQRRKTETALREAKEAAESASRAKTEFLAAMSHEWRTPLNAIIGFADMIDGEVLGPVGSGRYLEYVRHIKRSGQHMLRMITEILEFAEAEAGRMSLREEILDVGDLAVTAMRVTERPAAERGVGLELRVMPDVPELRADPTRIRRILVNLLSNAVKFSPEHGRVAMTVGAGGDGGVQFSVSDAGPGIAPADIPRALQPFGLANGSRPRANEGAGLGLAFSRRLAELHGGRLDIASRLGAGTTVTLRLPPERSVGDVVLAAAD